MAAVLLRRVFLQMEYKDLVEDLTADMLSSCQAELLAAIQSETSSSIRRKICDSVAELARSSIGTGSLRHIAFGKRWVWLLKSGVLICGR